MMDREQIRAHWQALASTYGEDLRATTKTSSIKELEINALVRAVRSCHAHSAGLSILEVGCGNGMNCLAVAAEFPNSRIQGLDFIQEMVDSAQALATDRGLNEQLQFIQGDLLDLAGNSAVRSGYDVIFSVRCLINLPEIDMQLAAVESMAERLRPGASLILLENNLTTYENQNHLRVLAGLNPRVPDAYNAFMDEDALLSCAAKLGLIRVAVEDFASLHDIVLYVLLPAVNGGTVDYTHPLVDAAKLVQLGSGEFPGIVEAGPFGPFGQNRLYHWRRAN